MSTARKAKPAFKDTKIRNAGVLCTHWLYGFKLYIPYHLANQYAASKIRNRSAGQLCNAQITIGSVTLGVHTQTKTLSGDVPQSWLVDLNANAIEETIEPETETLEQLF